jgi:hypothetical protein
MPFGSRRADLLERALQGGKCADPEVRDLAGTVGRIPALTAPFCAPAPEFVTDLGLRLRAEALTLPVREVPPVSAGSHAKASRRPRSLVRPRVLVIGTGLPRALAGATAALLLVGVVVGGTSRSALPGGLFYPVKQVLDSAAVQLAGSDFDRGVTWLSQAQEHISDAGALVKRDGTQADPASVDQALVSAYSAVGDGQRALLGEFDRTGNAQALIATQDFAVRALPQLSALRPLVPAASRPAVDALTALLEQTRTTLVRKIAVCGQPCASLGSVRLGGSPSSAPVTDLPTAGGRVVPGLPTPRGLPGDPTAAITAPGAVVVGPGGPPLRVPAGTRGAVLPPVTVASITVSPPPVVVVPLLPPLLPPATTALPAPPPGLPGLP